VGHEDQLHTVAELAVGGRAEDALQRVLLVGRQADTDH
jgi:hypothetical protein